MRRVRLLFLASAMHWSSVSTRVGVSSAAAAGDEKADAGTGDAKAADEKAATQTAVTINRAVKGIFRLLLVVQRSICMIVPVQGSSTGSGAPSAPDGLPSSTERVGVADGECQHAGIVLAVELGVLLDVVQAIGEMGVENDVPIAVRHFNADPPADAGIHAVDVLSDVLVAVEVDGERLVVWRHEERGALASV